MVYPGDAWNRSFSSPPWGAPLAELLWALARHHQRLVVEAHVVVAQRGALYLEGELLDPGAS